MLLFLLVSLAWPAYVLYRYPDMLEFWDYHYLGRLNRGFIGEPFWYYAVALPVDLLPWTPAAIWGLCLTGRRAFTVRYTPERFLWAWSLATPLFFSIPDGKHHHYLLHCLAPWAILAAPAVVRMWHAIQRWPSWLRHPGWSLLTLGFPISVGVTLLRHSFAGPAWIAPVAAASGVACAFLGSFFVLRRDARWALGGLFAVITLAYTLGMTYRSTLQDSYLLDNAFLLRIRTVAPSDRPLLAQDDGPEGLETFWLLYYCEARVRLVSGVDEVTESLGDHPEIFLVARRRDAAWLNAVGDAEEVLASEHTKGERSPDDRRVLFRVRNSALSLR
jgi:4-amino-4-deoxy-L-arabinose transferase-like glycosyltransferase